MLFEIKNSFLASNRHNLHNNMHIYLQIQQKHHIFDKNSPNKQFYSKFGAYFILFVLGVGCMTQEMLGCVL